MRRDGSQKRAVTTDGLSNDDPTWSPDGMRIAYSGKPGARADIFLVAATGGVPRNLTATAGNEEYNPAWSPDGRQIAYERTGCEVTRAAGRACT